MGKEKVSQRNTLSTQEFQKEQGNYFEEGPSFATL